MVKTAETIKSVRGSILSTSAGPSHKDRFCARMSRLLTAPPAASSRCAVCLARLYRTHPLHYSGALVTNPYLIQLLCFPIPPAFDNAGSTCAGRAWPSHNRADITTSSCGPSSSVGAEGTLLCDPSGKHGWDNVPSSPPLKAYAPKCALSVSPSLSLSRPAFHNLISQTSTLLVRAAACIRSSDLLQHFSTSDLGCQHSCGPSATFTEKHGFWYV